jgi:hypothetical protein
VTVWPPVLLDGGPESPITNQMFRRGPPGELRSGRDREGCVCQSNLDRLTSSVCHGWLIVRLNVKRKPQCIHGS